jgi:hypothetical protein
MALFTTSTGANVYALSTHDLVKIPVWKGNRILDFGHVEEIKAAVGDNIELLNNSTYYIASVKEMDANGCEVPVPPRYIIDGQHRHQVIKQAYESNPFAPEFQVLVFERSFSSEIQLIEYFNTINYRKALKPMEDENLVLNAYLEAIPKMFGSKKKMFRPSGCHKPNLSTDRLREALKVHMARLPKTEKGISLFASHVKAFNDRLVGNELYVLGIRGDKRSEMFEKGQKVGFILAYDDKLPWIQMILKEMGI